MGTDGIRTSPDGVAWTKAATGSAFGLFGVHHGNGAFIAVGGGGQVLTSPDGTTWTTETSSATDSLLNDVLFANGRFLIAGADPNTFLSSTDGAHWTGAAGVGDWTEDVAFGNATFRSRRRRGKIQTSPTASSGRRHPALPRLKSVAFGNGAFVAVGDKERW